MTPSLPTFFIASAMMLPICLSLLALIVPTCAINVALHVLVLLLDFLNRDFHGFFDAPLERHRVCAGGHGFDTLPEDRLREYRRRRRSIAGNVRGFRSDFAHHLRAHVFHRVFQFNLFGYGYAILGDDWRPKLLLDHRVATLGTQRNLDRIRQRVHAAQNRLP
jgi:hypothetical protein